ncbi:hypothetical protein JJB07_16670 [Tumebacillus sp. ITR2]|uniref:Uncharacterized protein n=1 Tax=Tumebacillus amylolyticus TaxID=2801339 RepID=A0ABS1JE33_9BACL|nr:hypothetical protein [Tumebacillus amylolyticus]MBL0388249.1 hypothetical protein [Tumebacillus amylolyticus]
MTILSALYIRDGERIEITPKDIQVHLYEAKYKGNLFCASTGCDAQIEYVHTTGSTRYFRTWKHNNHIDSCIHKFIRESGKVGVKTDQILHVEASRSKKAKVLDEAFAIAKLNEQEREAIRTNRRPKRSSSTTRTVEGTQIKLVLFDGLDEGTIIREGFRSPPILKREAAALKPSDVGKIRLVFGDMLDVESEVSRALFRLDGGNKSVHIRFEEAFFAGNPTYQGLFHHATRYCSDYQNVKFAGIGEVRLGATGEYELFVFQGQDFQLQNISLPSLAAFYTSGLMD